MRIESDEIGPSSYGNGYSKIVPQVVLIVKIIARRPGWGFFTHISSGSQTCADSPINQDAPAFPECSPTGWAIAFVSEIATETRDILPELR